MKRLLSILLAAAVLCGCKEDNLELLVRRGNVVRTELPAADDEGLYL